MMQVLMGSQLGTDGLYVGDLLAGEQALPGVRVFLPPYALSHHLGVFGRTGAGKSNLMMVLLRSVLAHNQKGGDRSHLKALPPAYWPLTPTMNFASGTQPQVAKTASMALSKATRPRSRQL